VLCWCNTIAGVEAGMMLPAPKKISMITTCWPRKQSFDPWVNEYAPLMEKENNPRRDKDRLGTWPSGLWDELPVCSPVPFIT
jgi:hypothetical protein